MNGVLLLLVKNNGQSEAKNIRIKVLELKNNGSNSKLISMIKRDIQRDIDKIKGVLQSNSSIQELTNIHMYIDGKYQSKISNWG